MTIDEMCTNINNRLRCEKHNHTIPTFTMSPYTMKRHLDLHTNDTLMVAMYIAHHTLAKEQPFEADDEQGLCDDYDFYIEVLQDVDYEPNHKFI